jgi:hypothetical protein
MTKAASMLTLVAFATFLYAEPPSIKIQATANAKSGRLIRLQAESNCPAVKWGNPNPDDCDLIPIIAEKAAIFSTPTVGTYRVFAYAGNAEGVTDPAWCVITVGNPIPPGPRPNPLPNPNDPLAVALQAAYAADTLPTKRDHKLFLQSLYNYFSTSVATANLPTAGDLYAWIDRARKREVLDTELAVERQIITAYLTSKIPASQVLDVVTRAAVAKELATVANALGAISG